MKSFLVVTIIALLGLIASCSRKSETSEKADVVQYVNTAAVKTSAVDDYYEAVGTVRAKSSSIIAARVTGNILSFRVREGDRVVAGQTLVELENRDGAIQIQKTQAGVRESQDALTEGERNIRAAEASQSAAHANQNLARSTFARYQMLFSRRSISPQEFDEVRTKLEIANAESERADRMLQAARARQSQILARIDQAKADVASARTIAGYSRVTSPINGIVVSKQADVGTMAMPGVPLLTIENDAQYQLEVSVEESQLSRIHQHDPVIVRVEAISNSDFACTVEEIVPASDPKTRSYIVKVALPRPPEGQLRSGLYGKARFVSGQRQVLAVPQTALTQRGQLVGVFVIDQSGVARLRLVKVGKAFGDHVEVLTGLSGGEQIVIDDLGSIQDGTRVRDRQGIASR